MTTTTRPSITVTRLDNGRLEYRTASGYVFRVEGDCLLTPEEAEAVQARERGLLKHVLDRAQALRPSAHPAADGSARPSRAGGADALPK